MKSLDPKVPEGLLVSICAHKYRNGKCTCHQGCNLLPAGCLNPALVTDMGEDIVVTHHDECELAEVRVGREVLQCVQLWSVLSEHYVLYDVAKHELLVQEDGRTRRRQPCCSMHDLDGRFGCNVRVCGGQEPSTYPRSRSLFDR